MGLKLVMVNLKARDDAAVGRFWAAALGWAASKGHGGTSVMPEGASWPLPDTVILDVIHVDDPRTVQNRMHLELATTSTAQRAELIDRLQQLGATPVTTDVPWTVLADPEGNVFCVREPGNSYTDTGLIGALVLDCADPKALARFWADAMDWTVHEVADDRALLRSGSGTGPYLELLRTPHLTGGAHRVHLDLLPSPGDDQAAEAARLEALGATPADVGQGDVPWKVLADPEGNVFCILGPA